MCYESDELIKLLKKVVSLQDVLIKQLSNEALINRDAINALTAQIDEMGSVLADECEKRSEEKNEGDTIPEEL